MDDPGVLGDRQVRAERELLVNRAQPERFGARRGIGALFVAGDDKPAAIRSDAAVQDMHEGRFASAVMADDADALAFSHSEIDAVQSPDGAVRFFDAAEIDDLRACSACHPVLCGTSSLSGRSSARAIFPPP